MPEESTTTASHVKLVAHIEQLGTLIGLASGALLILSVFYDFNFLLALGLTFEDVPTTISDHVRSAIVWTPIVGLMTLAFYMLDMFIRRVERGRTEAEIIASSSTPKFTRAFRTGANYLILVMVALFVILFGTSISWLYLGFVFVRGFLSISVVHHPRMGIQFSRTGGRLFIFVPIFVAAVGYVGYERGRRLLTTPTAQWEVTVKTERGVETRRLAGLRRFSDVAITVDLKNGVGVLPAESILVANSIRQTVGEKSMSCKWFGYLCPATEANSAAKQSKSPLQETPGSGRP
jgi:hypothetical protein